MLNFSSHEWMRGTHVWNDFPLNGGEAQDRISVWKTVYIRLHKDRRGRQGGREGVERERTRETAPACELGEEDEAVVVAMAKAPFISKLIKITSSRLCKYVT